jgi:DNA-binding MarR family transcriptional regulator
VFTGARSAGPRSARAWTPGAPEARRLYHRHRSTLVIQLGVLASLSQARQNKLVKGSAVISRRSPRLVDSVSLARSARLGVADTVDRPLGPVLDFMRLMWAINHGLDRASRGMQAQFGVTGPQRLVLRIVGSFPGLSAGDLARTLHVHPSTLTGILQRLERRGLLRRLIDPADARRVQLEVTTRGKRMTVPAVGTVESAIKRLMSAWTEAELSVTRRTLAAIAEELDGSPTGQRAKRTK